MWLRKEIAGSGALGDIAAHNIDLARFLKVTSPRWPPTRRSLERPLRIGGRRLGCRRYGRSGRGHRGRCRDHPGPVQERSVGHLRGHPARPRRRNYNCFEINGSRAARPTWSDERAQYFSLDDPVTPRVCTINVTGVTSASMPPPGGLLATSVTSTPSCNSSSSSSAPSPRTVSRSPTSARGLAPRPCSRPSSRRQPPRSGRSPRSSRPRRHSRRRPRGAPPSLPLLAGPRPTREACLRPDPAPRLVPPDDRSPSHPPCRLCRPCSLLSLLSPLPLLP